MLTLVLVICYNLWFSCNLCGISGSVFLLATFLSTADGKLKCQYYHVVITFFSFNTEHAI